MYGSSLSWYLFIVYRFQLFANLAQAHGCVGEDLVLGDLLLDDLCENYLEGEAEAALFQVLLEHERLLLSLTGLLLGGLGHWCHRLSWCMLR